MKIKYGRKGRKNTMSQTLKILCIALVSLLFSSESLAFGSKAKKSKKEEAIQAIPIRYVNMEHFTVPSFYLPDGNRVDMNVNLERIVENEINNSSYFRIRNNNENDENQLCISPSITSLELNILQLNLKIGWNPKGAVSVPIINNISGELDISLSNLSIDVKVYNCVTGETYLSSYTDQTLSELRFTLSAGISEIQAELNFVTRSKLSEAVRTATSDILKNMEGHSDFHSVPWNARVSGVDSNRGELFINVGTRAGLRKNQVYSVYSHCNSRPRCFQRFLSDIKIINTKINSSTAVPLTSSDSIERVKSDDLLYVKVLSRD